MFEQPLAQEGPAPGVAEGGSDETLDWRPTFFKPPEGAVAGSEEPFPEIEDELTPNISIGSSLGQQGQSEVGINFKWDY